MNKTKLLINTIPAILYNDISDEVCLFVHGKGGSKDGSLACLIAEVLKYKKIQLLSFDLPEHGERRDLDKCCDVFDGVKDLETVLNYAFENYKVVNVIGCSIGAYFTLHAIKYRNVNKCLFLSPIIDMEYLISQMFQWFNVDERMLEEKKEILTPIDPLRWDYYQFVKQHPIVEWNVPTYILYGKKDNLQSYEKIRLFCDKFHAHLTISENSEHPFMEEDDKSIIKDWLNRHI